MALNLQSLSLTSVFNSIIGFFRSQDNAGKWRELTNGSEGTFLIRLLSNVMSTLSYRIVAQSRENFLSIGSPSTRDTSSKAIMSYWSLYVPITPNFGIVKLPVGRS